MLKLIPKTLVMLAIFLVTPVVVLALNWQWEPESLNRSSEFFFRMTLAAGMPIAVIMCVFFTLVFARCLKIQTKKQFIKLLIILAIAILSGQVFKSVIKNLTADSRPFVLWIEKTYNVDDEYFYSLPRSERREIIKQYIHNSPEIPKWLYHHWCSETGYTFPSGHTLFATTWAFLALVLLNFRRYPVVISIIVAWAILIEISRLALGMHHPIDVICGAFLAWAISLFSYYLACKWKLIDP